MADSRKLPTDLEAVRKELLEVLESSPASKARFVQNRMADCPNLLSEFESLREEVRDILANLVESRADFLRLIAGEHLGILTSPDDVMDYLHDRDPKVRQAALVISSERWPFSPIIAKTCEQMVLSDADAEVRAGAALSLGSCFANTANHRVSLLLAKILLDEQNPRHLRLAAYIGLLEVHSRSLRDYVPSLTDIRNFRLPEQVDWKFVTSFALP